MNRFTWDLRYPSARDFPGLILWAASTRGPVAPPGRYQVTLTANGVSKTRDFAIVRNANVAATTDADLVEQFTLAKAISDKVSVAHEAVLRIRGLKEQIAARTAASADPQLKTAGATLTDKLSGVEGEIYQYRNRSNQDPLNYPIRLNNKLAALVESRELLIEPARQLLEHGVHLRRRLRVAAFDDALQRAPSAQRKTISLRVLGALRGERLWRCNNVVSRRLGVVETSATDHADNTDLVLERF